MSRTGSRTGARRGLAPLAALLAGLTCLLAVPARADGPYEGQWREGPMNIRVSIQSWGGDCGPRPQSTTVPGGGTFRITQSGDQLTFQLRQPRTTRSCWSENRAVRRVSSTHQAGTWRIVCRTPPEDSRGETGTYTIRAIGDDTLQFRDESRYDWQLNESRCQANIVTTQTFSRVSGGPTPTKVAEPEETPRRCTPGAPARIVLRPGAAEVPLGGEQCFTARVVDASGCTVRRASLAVAEGDPGRIEGSCYRAADADGTARVVASAGSLRAEARVTVRAMDLSDLIARRTETGSVGSGAPDEDASTQTAARVTTREAEEGPSLLWPIVALLAALLLVAIAAVLLRGRSTAAKKKKKGIGGLPGVELPDEEPPAAEATPPPPEPTGPAPAAAPAATAPGEDMICPTCRRGYPPGTERCPQDDAALMPYREFAAGRTAEGSTKENVCPVCGERYPATVVFCGKDGATLEPADA